MSEPEISRRCTACGASVRQSAAFCPQCGNPMSENSPATEVVDGMQPSRANTGSSQGLEADTKAMPPGIDKRSGRGKPSTVGRDTRRITTRNLEQNAPGPVGKLRKVSSVVIDQAAYDPSLRFLLVAGALFLLFLVALVLSKIVR
jgi:zinc-ribbon domain